MEILLSRLHQIKKRKQKGACLCIFFSAEEGSREEDEKTLTSRSEEVEYE